MSVAICANTLYTWADQLYKNWAGSYSGQELKQTETGELSRIVSAPDNCCHLLIYLNQ